MKTFQEFLNEEELFEIGPKVDPNKHLEFGTVVQINRPSHPYHKTIGVVKSHMGSVVHVQHGDGETTSHPVSALHHAS